MAAFDRLVAQEFTSLRAAGNTWPLSITVVGGTMYVLDVRRKIYAYNVTSKARDAAQDFDTLDAAGVHGGAGIWTDGETMYVADANAARVYAFNMLSKARDAAKDITLVEVEGVAPSAKGIWGNSRTIWVVYESINRVVAYDRVTLARTELLDFSAGEVPSLQDDLFDVWGTDTVVWIGDAADSTLYAYDLRNKRRLASLDFSLRLRDVAKDLSAATVRNVTRQDLVPVGLTFGGGRQPSSPGDPVPPRNALLVLNSSAGGRAQVWAFTRNGTATSGGIANSVLSGTGINPNGIRLTDIEAQDSRDTIGCDQYNRQVYRFKSGQAPSGAHGDYLLLQSAVDAGFPAPPDLQGIAWDGTSVYLADQRSHEIVAFTAGVKEAAKSITAAVVNSANPNIEFAGITWDGDGLLVLDRQGQAVWGFTGTARDADKDIGRESLLSANNAIVPAGIAYDGRTVYVIDEQSDGIYAFRGASTPRERNEALDIPAATVGGTGSIHAVATRDKDVFVSIGTSVKAFTYGTPAAIDPDPDYNLDAANLRAGNRGAVPAGVTFDGVSYVVADRRNTEAHGYRYDATAKRMVRDTAKDIPDSIFNAALQTLNVRRPIQLAGVAWDGTRYLFLSSSNIWVFAIKSDGAGGWTHDRTFDIDVDGAFTATVTLPDPLPTNSDEDRDKIRDELGLPDLSDEQVDEFIAHRNPANWQYGGTRNQASRVINPAGICYDGTYTYVVESLGGGARIAAYYRTGYVASRSVVVTGLPAGAEIRGIAFDSRGHFYLADFANSVAYAYDWRWNRDEANDLTIDDSRKASAVMWLNDISSDGTRLFLTDAYSSAIWAMKRTPAVLTAAAPTKDVAASVIGNGTTNITGLADDGTHLYCGFGLTAGTVQVAAVAGGAKVDAKSITNATLAAQGITRIDGMAYTEGELVILSAGTGYRFDDGVFKESAALSAVGVTGTARGIAYIGDTLFVADNSGQIHAVRGTEDVPRSFPAAFVNRTVAKIGGLAAFGDSLLVGQDGGRNLYGFTPFTRIGAARAEVENPEGFFASDGVMYVVSGGAQDRIFAFEMPVVPAGPYWATPSGPAQDWALNSAITSVSIPEAGATPDATYTASGLPIGVVFDEDLLTLAGTPTSSGSGTITITATNPYGTARYTIRYRVLGVVNPTWDSAGGAVTWYIGSEARYTVPAVDRGFPEPTYTITGMPAGFTFDAATRLIVGTPSISGSGTIRVQADTAGGTLAGVWTLAWTVRQSTAVPRQPYWGVPSLTAPAWTQDQVLVNVLVPAVDIGSPTPSYSAFQLPDGVVFDSTTRIISGTPSRFGRGEILIVATNVAGSAQFTVSYNIARSTVPAAPVFDETQGEAQFWGRGSFVSIQIPAVARGYPIPTYTAAGLPGSMTFDADTRTLSGTPTVNALGTVTITAANSQGTAEYSFVWSVVDSPPRFPTDVGPARVFVVGRPGAIIHIPRA